MGDEWAKSNASVILAAPSVIVPMELEYLIIPKHPDVAKLKINKAADFV